MKFRESAKPGDLVQWVLLDELGQSSSTGALGLLLLLADGGDVVILENNGYLLRDNVTLRTDVWWCLEVVAS